LPAVRMQVQMALGVRVSSLTATLALFSFMPPSFSGNRPDSERYHHQKFTDLS
jgi:hypothetical protein